MCIFSDSTILCIVFLQSDIFTEFYCAVDFINMILIKISNSLRSINLDIFLAYFLPTDHPYPPTKYLAYNIYSYCVQTCSLRKNYITVNSCFYCMRVQCPFMCVVCCKSQIL